MANRKALLQLKHFEVDEKRQQITLIESMIADFQRMIDDLDAQIEQEHRKTGITDVGHFAYSTFAKAAHQRKANLVKSIDGLKDQMADTQVLLEEAIADFKKHEMRDRRNRELSANKLASKEQAALDDFAARAAYGR